MNHQLLRRAALSLLLLTSLGINTVHAKPAQTDTIRFMVVGDWPYRQSQVAEAEALIDRMNQYHAATPVDFIVHVGDIVHPGDPAPDKLTCSNANFTQVRQLFDRWQAPWLFTPGDNEWADCARDLDDPHEPLERLTKIRQQFLLPSTDYPFEIISQTTPTIENRRWVLGDAKHPVVFAMMHVIGSHNNLTYTRPQDLEEFSVRNAANEAWLKETFTAATNKNAAAVVLFFHADPHFEGTPDQQLGFKTWALALAKAAQAFGKPVLLIHGDDHHFRIDQPFSVDKGWPQASNVFRLIGHGDPTVNATIVSITARPKKSSFNIKLLENVFEFQHSVEKAN